MKKYTCVTIVCVLPFVIAAAQNIPGKRPVPRGVPGYLRVCDLCIRAHEEFLASDVLQGRGSGTRDELLAATYVASQLRQYGIEPAGDNGGYIQRAVIVRKKLAAAPHVTVTVSSAAPIEWTFGNDFVIRYLAQSKFSGRLQTIDRDHPDAKIQSGSVVLIPAGDRKKTNKSLSTASSAGAVAALLIATSGEGFKADSQHFPKLPDELGGSPRNEMGNNFSVLTVSPEAAEQLQRMSDGAMLNFEAATTESEGYTWNAVGIVRGASHALAASAVLLTAHLDHLGIGTPVNGDDIYNGADDDASGTTAVLELARVLGKSPRPMRTVIFALFGSEETGGLGSTYFREHPPLPLKDISVNLEFEMIGRADSSVNPNTLWLTGWERSNLGPALAAHGAALVADPHPEQNFFARSDNYVLAKKGVVAQTVSSYGLHSDYHQPSDDLQHLDFRHVDSAIGSLLRPIEWLVNSSFIPQWNKGGQP